MPTDQQRGDLAIVLLEPQSERSLLPGAKHVFRFATHDYVACSCECLGCEPGAGEGEARALLRPVLLGGKLVEPLPEVAAARQFAAESIQRLPTAIRSLFDTDQKYRVEYSAALVARVLRGESVPDELAPFSVARFPH